MASLLKVRGQLPGTSNSVFKLIKPHHPASVRLLTTCQGVPVRTPHRSPYTSTASHTYHYHQQQQQCRYATTKVVEGDLVQPKPQLTWFQQLWRWLHDMDDLDRWDNPETNTEELKEREAFLNRVQEMYFAKPPVKPDINFCRESLEMLMKYNDRVAVQTLWNILPELKVEPDDELRDQVLSYLKKARQAAYYE